MAQTDWLPATGSPDQTRNVAREQYGLQTEFREDGSVRLTGAEADVADYLADVYGR